MFDKEIMLLIQQNKDEISSIKEDLIPFLAKANYREDARQLVADAYAEAAKQANVKKAQSSLGVKPQEITECSM